jgi:hypothetical protein
VPCWRNPQESLLPTHGRVSIPSRPIDLLLLAVVPSLFNPSQFHQSQNTPSHVAMLPSFALFPLLPSPRIATGPNTRSDAGKPCRAYYQESCSLKTKHRQSLPLQTSARGLCGPRWNGGNAMQPHDRPARRRDSKRANRQHHEDMQPRD